MRTKFYFIIKKYLYLSYFVGVTRAANYYYWMNKIEFATWNIIGELTHTTE